MQRTFAHDALGIGALVDWLVGQADHPQDIAVAIETPHGPVVEALMDRGIAVFAINPKQLDRFRDRFSRPAPRTTAGTPWSSPRPCAPIVTASAVSCPSTRWWSNCANGRVWPRS